MKIIFKEHIDIELHFWLTIAFWCLILSTGWRPA